LHAASVQTPKAAGLIDAGKLSDAGLRGNRLFGNLKFSTQYWGKYGNWWLKRTVGRKEAARCGVKRRSNSDIVIAYTAAVRVLMDCQKTPQQP